MRYWPSWATHATSLLQHAHAASGRPHAPLTPSGRRSMSAHTARQTSTRSVPGWQLVLMHHMSHARYEMRGTYAMRAPCSYREQFRRTVCIQRPRQATVLATGVTGAAFDPISGCLVAVHISDQSIKLLVRSYAIEQPRAAPRAAGPAAAAAEPAESAPQHEAPVAAWQQLQSVVDLYACDLPEGGGPGPEHSPIGCHSGRCVVASWPNTSMLQVGCESPCARSTRRQG